MSAGAGKGDTPRPLSVPQDTFAERWARTFGGAGKQSQEQKPHSPAQETHGAGAP